MYPFLPTTLAETSRARRRLLAAAANAEIRRAADAVILASALTPETAPEYTAYRHYTGNSVYGPERWAVRQTGQRDPVDIYRTRSGADHAARILNAGAARIDPHALTGCRIQPN